MIWESFEELRDQERAQKAEENSRKEYLQLIDRMDVGKLRG